MTKSEHSLEDVFAKIEESKEEIISSMCELVKIPAIDPRSGGEGETKKVLWLEKLLKSFGFNDIQHFDAPDEKSPTKLRPNILVKMKGKSDEKRIWIACHTDVVPPGDSKKWKSEPFKPVVKDGKIYGRGTEDNNQEMVAAIYALKILKDMNITPKYDVGLALVADEETGSKYGIKYIVNKGMFDGKRDFFIVPDGGNEHGTLIEIAEKSIMWLKVTTEGKQTHGSTPEKGINAFKTAIKFANELDSLLYSKYNAKNTLFDPPISTFEPTKKEANVPNVNTIPGDDVFYLDMRILPEYKSDEVLKTVTDLASKYEKQFNVKMKIAPANHEPAAPPTNQNSWIVSNLKTAIKTVYKNEPYVGGIGGGTCAAIFRKTGLDAVVWSKIDEVPHSPNEYCVIENLINDAKVYVALLIG
jgi:succinyl-diaminopimelate desuccinylase